MVRAASVFIFAWVSCSLAARIQVQLSVPSPFPLPLLSDPNPTLPSSPSRHWKKKGGGPGGYPCEQCQEQPAAGDFDTARLQGISLGAPEPRTSHRVGRFAWSTASDTRQSDVIFVRRAWRWGFAHTPVGVSASDYLSALLRACLESSPDLSLPRTDLAPTNEKSREQGHGKSVTRSAAVMDDST